MRRYRPVRVAPASTGNKTASEAVRVSIGDVDSSSVSESLETYLGVFLVFFGGAADGGRRKEA